MTPRATYRHPGGAAYRRPGGPWDVPTLDRLFRQRPVTAGPAVVDGDVALSAGELEARIAGVAGGLRTLGVRRGDVVAWQLPNWWEAVVLYRACWRLGAVAAPFHHQVGGREVARMLDVLAPSLPLAEQAGTLPVRGGDDRLHELVGGTPVATGPGRPSDLALVLFTSGSTGEPKAVLHSQRGLAGKAVTMARVHGLTGRDVVLMPSPMAHVSGLLNAVLVPGAAGMKTVLMEKWDPERGVALVGDEGVTFMIGPPTLFTGVMDVNGYTERVSTLRLVSCGSMGVTPEFVATAAAALGAVVKRTYGSTEAPTITTSAHDDPPEKAGSTDGRAVGEAEIRVVDPVTGRSCPPGGRGEVWLRGPELFCGYADPDQTRAAVHRGWFATGDLGTLDPDGWLTIVGRIKELIIRAGENIAAAEVERVLERHPAVRQAVVVGRPDERMGERVAAFVVADRAIDVDECRRWFADQQVARFKTPELVVNVDEVPVLGIGKPDRAQLRARAAALALGGG